MAKHGYTTEALFMRVPGFGQEGASVEKWKRIDDTPENQQLDNTIEYSGGVLEQFVGTSADDASTNDFIRFKIFPIDSSQGGLQDADSLRAYIQYANENNKFVYQDGEYYIKNPVYGDNLISERDAQIIMGDDTFSFPQNEFVQYLTDDDEDEDSYEDVDNDLNEYIERNDFDHFQQRLNDLFSSNPVNGGIVSDFVYLSELITEDDPREAFTIQNGERNGTIWQSIFSHHRLEMYETLMRIIVLRKMVLREDPITPETFYEENPTLFDDLVELAILYDWPEFLDAIGSEMVMAIAQGKSVSPNRTIFDRLQLDDGVSPRFDTPDCYMAGGQYLHGNPEIIIRRMIRRWLRLTTLKDAAGAFVWLTENLHYLPLVIDSDDYRFRSSEDNRSRRFREYAESEGARNVVAALNEM